MIRIRCHCGKSVKLPAKHLGKSASCPQCQQRVRIVAGEQFEDSDRLKGALIIRSGPRNQGEQVFLGGSKPIVVGKAEDAHLRLLASSVSRKHCRLVSNDRGWRIEDQGSTNGLFVNGRQVKGHNLIHGDAVKVGDFELQYSYEPGKRSTSALEEELTAPSSTAVGAEESSSPLGLHFLDDTASLEISSAAAAASSNPVAKETPAKPTTNDDEESFFEFAPDHSLEAGPPISLPLPGGAPKPTTKPPAPTQRKPVEKGPTCPSCKRTLPPRSKICVHCGIDVKTGRRLITSQETGIDNVYGFAEQSIRVISWIIPLGIYPVASEAYGASKPYVIRALGILTVIVSIWFLIGEWKFSPEMQSRKNLMLWAGNGPLDPDTVEYLYFMTPWGDTAAFDNAIDGREDAREEINERASAVDANTSGVEITGTTEVPEDLKPSKDVLAAHESLSPEQRCIGEFKPYQLLTHALLHGDLLHLAGNLLFLFVLGSRVNALIGNIATAVVYPLLAVGAGVAYMVSETNNMPMPMIGASGAVMGLAGMYFVFFPVHKVHVAAWFRWGLIRWFELSLNIFDVRGFWVVLFYIAFDVVITAIGVDDGVAHWAHLGGFGVGIVVALLLMITRITDARGGDLLSVMFGRHIWWLIGRPGGQAAADEAE